MFFWAPLIVAAVIQAAPVDGVTGQGSVTLGAVQSTSSGTVSTPAGPITGQAAAILDAVQSYGAGLVGEPPVIGAGVVTLGDVLSSASGTVADPLPVFGSASVVLGSIVSIARGRVAYPNALRRWSSIRGEPKLSASDLGSRVTLQKRTTGVDAAGQGFDTWEAWATVWANVRRVSARDYDSAGQPQASGLVSIVIRCRDGIEPGMRVLCDGQAWDIVGDPVAMSAGLLRFEAASGVRDAV